MTALSRDRTGQWGWSNFLTRVCWHLKVRVSTRVELPRPRERTDLSLTVKDHDVQSVDLLQYIIETT